MSDNEHNSDPDDGAKEIDEEPHESDVLCGRGGAALRHPGNQTYRRLVHLNKGLYITCLKAEKLKISRSIVAAIREQNGRFLERDPKKGTWYDIGDKKAMEKTSQALREGQPKLRQKIVEFGGGAAGAAAMLESQFPGGQLYNLHQHPGPACNMLVKGSDQIIDQMAQALDLNAQIEKQLQSQQEQYESQQSQGHQHQHDDSNDDMFQRLSLSEIQEEPSFHQNNYPNITARGSMVAADLGIESTFSLLSDYSSYGMAESQLALETQQQAFTMSNTLPQQQSSSNHMGPPEDMSPGGASNHQQAKLAFTKLDRRKHFAIMKYSRPASGRSSSGSSLNLINSQQSLGTDGMPDIHLVESAPSLLSNTSSVGSEKVDATGAKIPDVANIFESRRSMMSGLSKISDTSEVNSIFSDLSRKIGNISTRSIAMSEISNMDDHGDIDNLSVEDSEKLHSVASQRMPMDFD